MEHVTCANDHEFDADFGFSGPVTEPLPRSEVSNVRDAVIEAIADEIATAKRWLRGELSRRRLGNFSVSASHCITDSDFSPKLTPGYVFTLSNGPKSFVGSGATADEAAGAVLNDLGDDIGPMRLRFNKDDNKAA